MHIYFDVDGMYYVMVTLHLIVGTIYDFIYEVSYQDIEMTVFVLRGDEICIYHIGIIYRWY